MSTPHTGFEFVLQDARRAAEYCLPKAADHIREPISDLLAPEPLDGPGDCPEAAHAQVVYAGFAQYIAHHLNKAAAVADGVADALKDICDLYARADGQA
ncbi:hypothetical protein ACFQV2_03600 [Actinokineospora soli]|uniref:PE family protein n=1 Tax=Actinokineospora soli TaxID=1048753 RepID=A0ABW2TGI2_9PSEU